MGAVSTCDSHVHVFDPARYPYAAARKFTPASAVVSALSRYLDRSGMGRVVLVQPSVYGTDNRCMVDALAQLGGRAKGIAVVAPDAQPQALESLTRAGVVGARLNMVVNRSDDATQAVRAIEMLDALLPAHWHIQLHVSLAVLASVAELIARSRRLFVLDHLGLPAVQDGTASLLWQRLLTLTRNGQLCVKLSGPYLSSRLASPYPDLQPFVETLAQANPEALLWGSNWPHTQGVHRSTTNDRLKVEKFRIEDDLAWSDACARWLGRSLYERMHTNAHRVYGFDV